MHELSLWQIVILSLVQGLAELLPVSSSAHVIVMEKLMGLDPSSPQMTFLLVMLHTGTMFAVIVCFWRRWLALARSGRSLQLLKSIVVATLVTGAVGFGLKVFIEKVFLSGEGKAEIEQLFSNMLLISLALAAAGVVILVSSLKRWQSSPPKELTLPAAGLIGAVQGLCLPFRGFSRSGATISTGLMCGLNRLFAEEFSFILAVVLTPPVIGRELLRLLHARHEMAAAEIHLHSLLLPGLLGMIFSFVAGTLAIRWLSSWLESGKWHFFGVYCVVFAVLIFALQITGII